ncbi:unnamed protein product [Sphagnum jensenii]|uniref:Uncharacterized protein n=1 Tax=Sphagnum jensenii TaxID=128206 RepID=A0ABP0VF83_9BRYO
MASAVSTSTNGLLVLTDVTSETLSEAWVGLASAAIPAAAIGQVSSDGRIQNIPVGLGFSVGDPIWVGVTPGSLTNDIQLNNSSGYTLAGTTSGHAGSSLIGDDASYTYITPTSATVKGALSVSMPLWALLPQLAQIGS